MGMTCATIAALASAPRTAKERTGATCSIAERRDRLTEQRIGAGVLQRDAVLRAPPDVIGQRLDQMVRGQNLALIVENQRRQADERQRFAGDARALQSEPCRHERAAGKVGPQCVQLLDEGRLNRPARMVSFYTEDEPYRRLAGERRVVACQPKLRGRKKSR